MIERQPIGPLVVGLVIASILHAVGLSLLTVWWIDPWAPPQHDPVKDPKSLLPIPQKITLGRDTPRPSTVAWIAFDSFQKLVAPPSRTEQPALQQQVEPVTAAPMPVDPTEPVANPVDPDQVDAPAQPSARSGGGDSGGGAAPEPTAATVAPVQGRSVPREDNGKVSDEPAPASASVARPASPQYPAQANPTAAARSDRESTPSRLKTEDSVLAAGAVLVSQGIEIKTVRPRFSMVTRVSTVPNDPVVRVVFNPRDGSVINAVIVRSSGYESVDGPVLASLYQWRAQGQQLQQHTRPIEVQIQLILSGP